MSAARILAGIAVLLAAAIAAGWSCDRPGPIHLCALSAEARS